MAIFVLWGGDAGVYVDGGGGRGRRVARANTFFLIMSLNYRHLVPFSRLILIVIVGLNHGLSHRP